MDSNARPTWAPSDFGSRVFPVHDSLSISKWNFRTDRSRSLPPTGVEKSTWPEWW